MKQKTARKWLNKNKWKIAMLNVGIGSSKKSCFHKQMKLCQRALKV